MILKNKKILLAITGSIAVYKVVELIRVYIKAGADVKVTITPSALKFISKLTLQTISTHDVLCDDNESWSHSNFFNHIALSKWADTIVVAPATANTINKLSNGIADNILLQTILAFDGKKLLCPSANTKMLNNPITKANIKMLKLCNFKIVEPISKTLACGDEGFGALAEIEDIFHNTARILLENEYYKDRLVVVSSGGTIESIDDMRYISNHSSGKMANSIAKSLFYQGADVCMVKTKTALDVGIKDIHVIEVDSAKEMYDMIKQCIVIAKKGKLTDETLMDNSTKKHILKKPYFFALCAVSDWRVRYPQTGKIKKKDIGDIWHLELKQNIDILKSIDKSDIYTIGFKAEMDQQIATKSAKDMLKEKNLSAVCLNILNKDSFGSDENSITIVYKDEMIKLDKQNKLDLSFVLLKSLEKKFDK
ncbi:MAG: phosphopantothenoylcysteine decarboxylase [Campylobacteraceae bacterium 4484_166]|nr:MAG: phosphopantothenoylcysteine decarboxylase [Campylobacteraceae bacterium 4484_166]